MGAPASDQAEVCVFGPGFGESSAVHLGNGKWLVIDSCVDRDTKEPAALQYLQSIGISPTAVELIIITHWHDDHIRGMARLVEACSAARVCLSSALRRLEFRKLVTSFSAARNTYVTSGVDEISRTLHALIRSRRKPVAVVASKRLLAIPVSAENDLECEVWGLSPSDAQFARAMQSIAKQIPGLLETKIRAPDPDQNDLSIAAWVRIGDIALLFGADLEESGKPDFGWSAVLADPGRPRGRAILFKIPHHGSSNGHHDGVWDDMLESTPIAVLTPYDKNRGLPRQADVDRILSRTEAGFSTSRLMTNKFRRPRTRAVEKTIVEVTESMSAALAPGGQVRVRFTPPDMRAEVTLAGNACHLRDVLP